MPPEQTAPRLLLKPATAADLDDLWRLLIAPEVRRYLCDDTELTLEQVAGLLDESIARASVGLGLWMIRSPKGEVIGCVGLQPVSAAAPHLAGEVEPLVALAPAYWGQGFAVEALSAVLTYAHRTLGLQRIVALVDEPNAASHRLMVRVGFVVTGISPGPRYPLTSYRLTF
jgi:ribosomal-protein-alanine N-acetyltransferase